MADSDKQILITPNISQTTLPQIKFVGKDNAPMYQTVQDDGTIAFSAAQGEVFSIGPTMASGTIFSANDISGVPLLKVLASGAVNVASGRLCVGTDTPVDGMSITLNGDGTAYEGIAWQVDGSTKWKMSTDSSGFYWDSQVNTMDINFRLKDSGGNQNIFRFTTDGGLDGGADTLGPKFVVGASSHTIPDGQAGIEIIDAGQSTLRVTDSDGNASSDFAQSGSDGYIINRVTNGDLKFRVNSGTEVMTLDGGDVNVKFPKGVEGTGSGGTYSSAQLSTSPVSFNLCTPFYYARKDCTGAFDLRIPNGGDGDLNQNGYIMPRSGKVKAITLHYSGANTPSSSTDHEFQVRVNNGTSTEEFALDIDQDMTNAVGTNYGTTVVDGSHGYSEFSFAAGDLLQIRRHNTGGGTLDNVNGILWVMFDSD